MRAPWVLLVACLLVSPLALAHVFNHEDRHEVCEVDVAPHGHGPDDGHAHTHDATEGEALHNHDPCKQVRMDYPWYENSLALNEISVPLIELDPIAMLFSDGDPNNTEVYVAGEAYRFDIPEHLFKKQTNLAVTSDLVAAAMGFPGSGEEDDPYIVEGYFITNTMLFKDTSDCFVIRNNVVVDKTFVGPLIDDPENIIRLADLTPIFEQALAEAEALREEYLNLSATWEALRATWDQDKAAWDAQRSVWDADLADYQARDAAWRKAFQDFEDAYLAAVADTEGLTDEYEFYARDYYGYTDEAAPAKVPQSLHDDLDALIPAFEGYQFDADGYMVDNPPPEEPPEGYSASSWQVARQNMQTLREAFLDEIAEYADLMPTRPDQAAYDAFLAEYDTFLAEHAAFMAEYDAFLADHGAFVADHDAFLAEFDQVWAQTGATIAEAEQHFADAASFTFRYLGFLFNTLDELLEWILELLLGPGHDDPNDDQGQLILDWNGQCVHAYNNVVHDLRVNQNNDRTGYATGGIIEDSRFYEIGQIRHYDGIFRENEVGNRDHLRSLIDPTVVPPAGRTVNNDGANQGWYRDNVFYGQIDLDFHGHHHSAGFFAPESHYHGSDHGIAYMRKADGSCSATHDSVDHMKIDHEAPNPHHDYPKDNDIDLLGETLVDMPDQMTCLPHMEHGKRWTSVFFNENIFIDPRGVGLRFEDRDHRADDEKANSENMYELKAPHYHRKWVQMEDNVVVGRIFIDVLNAKGTDLWSDDWSEVLSPTGAGRTLEALAHPGAEIVNSHPYRNDAWLDIQRNVLLATGPTAVLVADAEDMTLFQFKQNTGTVVPIGARAPFDEKGLLAWLNASRTLGAADLAAEVGTWGAALPTSTLLMLRDVRDGFRVEVCGNEVDGFVKALVATDRIYDDGASIIRVCGDNLWGGADPAISLAYTPVDGVEGRFSDGLRELTDGTDDFYATELVYDAADAVLS